MNNFSDLNDIKKIHETLAKKKSNFEYSGSYKNNLKHGTGTEKLVGTDLTYIGQWSNGVFHGVGKLITSDYKVDEFLSLFLPSVVIISSMITSPISWEHDYQWYKRI